MRTIEENIIREIQFGSSNQLEKNFSIRDTVIKEGYNQYKIYLWNSLIFAKSAKTNKYYFCFHGYMTTTTKMELVDIGKLIPYINNARTHSPEQITKLRSSLREFGFINPVIIDRNYGVIAGHGRILAAKEEGITEVPCVFADHLTEAQKKAYIIADNRMAMDAGWDEELLRVEIEALRAEDLDPLLTGFDAAELDELFSDNELPVAPEDEEEPEE